MSLAMQLLEDFSERELLPPQLTGTLEDLIAFGCRFSSRLSLHEKQLRLGINVELTHDRPDTRYAHLKPSS